MYSVSKIKALICSQFDKALISFLIVGATCTLFQLSLLTIFIELFAANKIFASALSYMVSALLNYYLNYHFTFNSQQTHQSTFYKFVLTSLSGVLLNTLLFGIALAVLGYYLVAQCVAIGGTLITNFLLHKYWIYRRDS